MPQTKSTNTFKSGLNLSVDNINQPKDTYSYGLNVAKEDPINNPEIIANERGFSKYLDLGYEYFLLGTAYLGGEDYVLFIKSILGAETLFNRIILLQDQIATVIYDTTNLNFQDQNIIKATYRINYKNERIIYWVDGLNEDRVLNLDNGESTGDVDELAIDVKYKAAILTDKVVNDDGGSLLTGTYEFYASYKTKDNATTPWFLLTANPIYVIDDNTQTTTNYIIIDGCDSGIPTNKVIQLTIANLDPSFTRLRIGVIKTLSNNSTGIYIDDIFYNSDTITYNYTGTANEIMVPDITEFTVDTVKYYASNVITQMDNRLLRGNMKSNKIDIGYQSFANNIVTDYYVEEELVSTMQDSTDYNIRSNWWQSANTKYSDKKSLMRDEVYSVGIAFGLIKEGVESEVYHIPGRALNDIPNTTYNNQYDDSATIAYNTTWDSAPLTENGVTTPTWQVVNTAALSSDNTIHKLAYWESAEIYPDGLDLPITGSSTNGVNNTKIRHHKIPSSGLEPIFRTDETDSIISFYKRHIGLTFTNIEVPEVLKDNIAYIRFYISPRISDANKSIIAKGIFANCSLTKVNVNDFDTVSTTLYIHPCNPYNDLNEITNGNCYREGQDDGWDTKTNHYHAFHSPDTSLRTPVINTNKIMIENEFTGIVHYYNTIASNINADPYRPGTHAPGSGTDSSSNNGYKRDLFYDDSNNGTILPTGQTSSHAIYNVTPGNFRSTYKSISILNDINQVHNSLSRRKLKQAVYVPFNAQLSVDQMGGMDNPYTSGLGSAAVIVELDPTNAILGPTQSLDNSVEFSDNDPASNYLDPNMPDFIGGTFHFHVVGNPTVVYRYGSLKKDNASQYGTIDDGIEYNPTDLVIANPTFSVANIVTDDCSGLIGDCWIDMFSVKRCRFTQKEYYTFGGKPEASIGISTFFTESNINHRLRYAEGTDFREYYPKQVLTTPIKEYLDAGFNLNILEADNYYKENTDFDKQVTKKNFGISELDLDLFGVTSYSTRILYSEKLLDETRVDDYRVFLANNYRDLPKDKGFLTHLFKKNQELYAVTRDALWRVFASNDTIKSDVSNITVGTGDFFSLEPTEMLSIEGGYGGSSSKFSLVECPYGYFYVDKNKGKLILFRDRQSYYDNSQQVDISLPGVYNFIRSNFELTNNDTSAFDTPLQNSGYTAGYDPELKRILVTKLDYELTTEQIAKYRGIYNPATSYSVGDIYLKDGIYYTYNGAVTEYTTVYSSSNLSDFFAGSIDAEAFTFSTPTNGTATKIDSNTLRYTATGTGTDEIDITMNCVTTPININITTLYHNVEAHQTFTRNNCTTGSTGTSVLYSVSANTYTSTISQADADAKAAADIAANGQNYANTNGTCIPPATLVASLTETVAPYADGNIQLRINGVVPAGGDIVAGGTSTTFLVPDGSSISIQAYTQLWPTGTSASMRMVVVKNSSTVFDTTIAAIPGTSPMFYTDTATSLDTYSAAVTTTASGDGGYAVTNNTTHNIGYIIRPSRGSGTTTSSGTLLQGNFLDMMSVLPGGGSSYIEFISPSTNNYSVIFQNGGGGPVGSITAGSILYDINTTEVTSQEGLGYNSTVLNLVP